MKYVNETPVNHKIINKLNKFREIFINKINEIKNYRLDKLSKDYNQNNLEEIYSYIIPYSYCEYQTDDRLNDRIFLITDFSIHDEEIEFIK